MAQEAAGWLQTEEEEKRKATQEEARKAEEEEKKKKLDEELQKKEVERLKLTQTEQSVSETAAGQTHDMENPEVQDPQVPAASTPMVPTLKLVPFVQKKGEEISDFNTIFYDRATKRIVKRTERKIETGDLLGKMISDTPVMLGTDQDPRFTIRTGAALIQASEDNVGRIMTNLELSKMSSAQLKDTLRREREESNRLKWKYEDMHREIKDSKAELQALQIEIQVRGTTQEFLEKVQKEYQELNMEKERLLGKVEELEEQ